MDNTHEAESDLLGGLPVPDRVWLELHHEKDACDVIVRMEDSSVYTALFVTIPYLQRQMDLSFQVTQQIPDTPAVRYTVIDTPHILVDSLDKSDIEDTIDNLIALDVFESHFTQVTENQVNGTARTTRDGKLATQEVAAVVISDVLVISDSQ